MEIFFTYTFIFLGILFGLLERNRRLNEHSKKARFFEAKWWQKIIYE